MPSVQNQIVAITCDDYGNSLTITDKKRGTRWLLDHKSLGYGSAPRDAWGRPDPNPKLLVPARARSDNLDELTISYQAGEHFLEIGYFLRDDYVEVCMAVPTADEIGFA